LAAPAAILGFLLVGHFASRAEECRRHFHCPPAPWFDWELASIFGTAVGTVMLAIATGFLALTTFRDVTATEMIARETQEDRRERGRPTVLLAVLGAPGALRALDHACIATSASSSCLEARGRQHKDRFRQLLGPGFVGHDPSSLWPASGTSGLHDHSSSDPDALRLGSC
jgi:hypothetical protein